MAVPRLLRKAMGGHSLREGAARLARLPPARGMSGRGGRTGSVGELFGQRAHREVDAHCADVITAQVVDH